MQETIKLKVLDDVGHILLTAPAGEEVHLVYAAAYRPGDRIALEIGTPGQFCVVQFEDTMPPALVYVEKREINFAVPFAQKAEAYNPKSFQGNCHIIRARLATEKEIRHRRNLACNPYDLSSDTGFFPHAASTVEHKAAPGFAARNAIDGITINDGHGFWPYQSWSVQGDPDAALTIHFGRPVTVDEIRLSLRADFPHDS